MFTVDQSVTLQQLVIQYCPWLQTPPSEIYAVSVSTGKLKIRTQSNAETFDFPLLNSSHFAGRICIKLSLFLKSHSREIPQWLAHWIQIIPSISPQKCKWSAITVITTPVSSINLQQNDQHGNHTSEKIHILSQEKHNFFTTSMRRWNIEEYDSD